MSIVASTDVLATVLEEMPSFPEREGSILAALKKKKPGRVPENEIRESKSPLPSQQNNTTTNHKLPSWQTDNSANADLLELSTPTSTNNTSASGTLIDVLGDIYSSSSTSGTAKTIQKKQLATLREAGAFTVLSNREMS